MIAFVLHQSSASALPWNRWSSLVCSNRYLKFKEKFLLQGEQDVAHTFHPDNLACSTAAARSLSVASMTLSWSSSSYYKMWLSGIDNRCIKCSTFWIRSHHLHDQRSIPRKSEILKFKKQKGAIKLNQPETEDPQCFSTPSTAAAIAFPFSAALSIRAIASYKHFSISSKAITSPCSTTALPQQAYQKAQKPGFLSSPSTPDLRSIGKEMADESGGWKSTIENLTIRDFAIFCGCEDDTWKREENHPK